MTAFNWDFDSNVGVYTNHALSNELLVTSVGRTKILPFTQLEESFGAHQGATVNLMHVKELPLPTSAQLAEDTRVPIDRIEYGNRAITVVEWGRGVEFTRKAQLLGKFDPQDVIQKRLINQMHRAMDQAAGAAFQDPSSVPITFIPTSATSGVFDTDGTPSTVATSNLTLDHIGILADYLAGTIHVPPYEGEDYIMLSSRKTLRGIKQDPLFVQWHQYLQRGDLFFRGEAGRAENIRMIEVHLETSLSNTAGTSTVLGEAVVFGDEAVARVEVEAPHLRAEMDFQSDFGRKKAVAWYGLLAFASRWATANDGEAKIIRITSA